MNSLMLVGWLGLKNGEIVGDLEQIVNWLCVALQRMFAYLLEESTAGC